MEVGSQTSVLVTGASKGIGRATARAFAERGAKVGLVARSAADLERLAAELPGDGHLPLPADVCDREAIAGAMDELAREHGAVDVCVANAGIAHYGPFLDIDLDLLEDTVEINVMGTLYTVRAAAERMADQGRGHIVVVSSGAGLRSFPSAAVYGATKAFGHGLGQALRHELSGTGVSVSVVYPGEVQTELHAHERDRMPDWRKEDEEIDPRILGEAIVGAVEGDRRSVAVPRIVGLLGLSGIAPGLVDRILRVLRGPTAAPRR